MPGCLGTSHAAPPRRYHLKGSLHLQRANDQPGGRAQLRAMKVDLLAGKMTL